MLLRAIGLFVVFGCEFSLGENVLSLLSHSHWKVIEDFAKTFSTWTAVDINLARIAPMQRPRLFMAQTKLSVHVEKTTIGEWIHIALQNISVAPQLHHIEDATRCLRLDHTMIPLLKDPLLCFNPCVVTPEKRATYGHGLAERVYDYPQEVLPVLMSNYSRQHKLPRHLLERRGLLTWLISDLEDRRRPIFASLLAASRGLRLWDSICLDPGTRTLM